MSSVCYKRKAVDFEIDRIAFFLIDEIKEKKINDPYAFAHDRVSQIKWMHPDSVHQIASQVNDAIFQRHAN